MKCVKCEHGVYEETTQLCAGCFMEEDICSCEPEETGGEKK